MEETVWLVERTYSDDEQNLIILVYATPEGKKYIRKERALTSYSGNTDTPVAIEVSSEKLSRVTEEELQERYKREASRMQRRHDPDNTI